MQKDDRLYLHKMHEMELRMMSQKLTIKRVALLLQTYFPCAHHNLLSAKHGKRVMNGNPYPPATACPITIPCNLCMQAS